MGKLNAELRKKVIEHLAMVEAESWVDMSYDDFRCIIEGGHKGYVDYTDEELLDQVETYVDLDESDSEWVKFAAEMEAELAIETMLSEEK